MRLKGRTAIVTGAAQGTPMREADLRLHLQAQTDLPVSAVTLLDVRKT